MEQQKTKRPLPELKDLHHDVETAFKTDKLNLLLNQPPHQSWIKNHPTATTKNDKNEVVKARYIPIDKVEFLLTRIFQEWRVEVLREGLMMNSVFVTVRLHYRNPITGEWSYHDGCGAKSLQLDAGSRASDLVNIKEAAVMMAFPSAKSYAIKDAAEHFGALFGRDLNRRNIIQFSGSYDDGKTPPVDAVQPVAPVDNTGGQTAELVL